MLRGRVENNDGVGVSGCGVIITTSNGSAYNTKSESDGSFSFLVSLGNLTIATYPSDNTLYLPGDSISSYAELDVDLFIVTYLKPRYGTFLIIISMRFTNSKFCSWDSWSSL